MVRLAVNDPLGAFIRHDKVALEPRQTGPLSGLTFATKDIFDIRDHVTGCGNPTWFDTHERASRTAPIVETLLEAGARMVGKTITDELAYSLNGQNHHYGTPVNVYDPSRIPGGSSSGSASATAGGLVDFALGSDTGGSVRIPASFNGLYGLRPTHGRIALDGVMPLAPSYDTIGWFADKAEILRRVGEVVFEADVADAPTPARVLIADDLIELVDPKAIDALSAAMDAAEGVLGPAEHLRLSRAGLTTWKDAFRVTQAGEIQESHRAWIESATPNFGPEIAERFDWAMGLDARAIEAAKAERQDHAERVREVVGADAVIMTPTAPTPAPKKRIGAEELRRFRDRVLSMTCVAGMAGLPQLSMPFGQVDKLPVGLSLIAPAGWDEALLKLAPKLAQILGRAEDAA